MCVCVCARDLSRVLRVIEEIASDEKRAPAQLLSICRPACRLVEHESSQTNDDSRISFYYTTIMSYLGSYLPSNSLYVIPIRY